VERIAWDDLPGPLKEAIAARTGPVIAARTATAGQNSPLAVIITTRDGMVFAKGMPSGHRGVVTQAREIAVAPLVRDISPSLLWHFDEGGWAWLVDWAWPTLGAAWTDPACWVLRLMAPGGHTPREAERQAARHPAFAAADPAHLDLFAAANVRLWAEIAQSSPRSWTKELAQAARAWSAYRQARAGR
jgi:hypothetical protein